METNLLSHHLQIFYHNLWVVFCFAYCFLCCAKDFSRSHLLIFVCIILGDNKKKILFWFMSESVLPVFSYSRSFIVSGLTFRSLIHFELIFVCGVKEWSNFFFFFTCSYPVCAATFVEETSSLLIFTLCFWNLMLIIC